MTQKIVIYSLSFLFCMALLRNGKSFDTEDTDSLAKYSYMMVGFKIINGKEMVFPLGTCFFIKQGNITKLVTARHNFTGINTFDGSLTSNQFEDIGFRYLNKKTNQVSFSRISIANIKKKIPRDLFYKMADAIAVTMTDTIVEPFLDFIDEKMLPKAGEKVPFKEISAYGFPYIDSTQYNKEMKAFEYSGRLVSNVSIRHRYPINNELYFIATPKSVQGLSGSPVFCRYVSAKTNKVNYKLVGVIFGTHDELDYAYCVNYRSISWY